MDDYTSMTPEARFIELDRMATQLFGSKRWKAAFCRRYGFTNQTLTKWTNTGAPLWAVVAVYDALAAQKLDVILRKI